MGAPPATIRRVEQHLESPRGLVDLRYDSRKYHHFLSKEGKVEFAIDALINVTRNVAVDGDDGWEYGIFDQIESLPATHTPFDDAFDIARFKSSTREAGKELCAARTRMRLTKAWMKEAWMGEITRVDRLQ
jgi:hypothetical protein